MTLFSHNEQAGAPLADRMRPRTLDEFYGQEHIVGPGCLLRRAIEADRLTSSIFYGPPGCGKTTLAGIIARQTNAAFIKLNAVTSGVSDVREELKKAADRRALYGQPTYLLLDECHRWSKAQSDSILPAMESGLIRFIGSTTENPMISMTPAIVSRCRVFAFQALTQEDVEKALRRAIADEERGLGKLNVRADEDALRHIARIANGDVRTALNAIELAVLTTPTVDGCIHITLSIAEDSIQQPVIRCGDTEFYDMLSAFCKSMRGSDPDAALLWFSRLLYAGADPRMLARRVIAHASEDVGLANPIAMLQAVAAAQALETVGMPEARLSLTQAIIAVCVSPKSNAVVMAMDAARQDAEQGGFSPVPAHLRDSHYAGNERLGVKTGEAYKYPHDYPGHWVAQQYMPDDKIGVRYYFPSDQGHEAKLKPRGQEDASGSV
ncbi:MAG: replication-associated recombination protein A [Clostridia bacterium]|nr:replication-associated recombination protein A [Clostridia bacterium]